MNRIKSILLKPIYCFKGVFDIIRNNIIYYKNIKLRRSINIISIYDSVDYILQTNCSLSRFGDGEFGLILERSNSKLKINSGFQSFNNDLSKELESILREGGNKEDNHIVGLPACMFGHNTSYLKKQASRYWRKVGNRILKTILEYINPKNLYLDSTLTRFYISHKDKSRCASHAEKLKKIWENRDIIIIEGEKTRLGVGNDLFSRAKSIHRILAPNKDAYNKIELIFQTTIQYLSLKKNEFENPILLLALGMTATVLARKLAPYCQALDIGHIDIEYEWMKLGATSKVPITGKFTNEALGGDNVKEIHDADYNNQIISIIKL